MTEKLYKCTKCGEYKASRVLTECDNCINKQIELERLADIGRATEKAMVDGVILTNPNRQGYDFNVGKGEYLQNIDQLLEWAKGGK